MYKDKIKPNEVYYDVNFLYFTDIKPVLENINASFNRFMSLNDVKANLQLRLENKQLTKISRVFIYKFVNGKKTWSKVITVNIGNRVTPDFLKFIGV